MADDDRINNGVNCRADLANGGVNRSKHALEVARENGLELRVDVGSQVERAVLAVSREW